MLPLRRMWERVDITAHESDVAYFYDLLHLGELLTKIVVTTLVASISNREGNRYQLERDLLRADGLGDWVAVLHTTLVGPASSMMSRDAQPFSQQITQTCVGSVPSWQSEAVRLLHRSCHEIESKAPGLPPKVSLRWWFDTFVWLRNRTRGHGSTLPGTCAEAVGPLAESLRLITNSLDALTVPCAVIRRNLSGKYRVVELTTSARAFKDLRRHSEHSYPDGIYYSFHTLRYTPLCSADIDLSDIYVANGSFRSNNTSTTYEVLSYITDSRERLDGARYLNSVPQLPDSNTHGYPELDVLGETFTNVPPQASDYVTRDDLEQELRSVLTNDRHPFVSVVGRGGIGKTSLALKVLRDLCETTTYESILWFSARDIDLLSDGPKGVRPQVLTFSDIANEFLDLLRPYGLDEYATSPELYLARALSCQTDAGPMLLVVDNLETVRSPSELYHTLDTHVRLPNKVLITARHHDFRAGYRLEVGGMTRPEYDALVRTQSQRLKLSSLLTTDYLGDLYQQSEGHPYVVKVMLGEVAVHQKVGKVSRILATKDRMLDVLFERSYTALTPDAQRVFLTLCNWRSMVTQLELEAALARPENDYLDTSKAISSLASYSMIEVLKTNPDTPFLRIPEAARIFGKKKLRVSHMKPVIDVDTGMLQEFGTVRSGDIKIGLAPRVDQMVYNVAKRAALGENVSQYMDILEYIANDYPRAWLKIAELRFENPQLGDPATALDAVERYLQEAPDDADAWRRLAAAAREFKDPDREMNALYRLGTLSTAVLEDTSNAATCLSRHLAHGNMTVGRAEKRRMANQLAQMMNAQLDEATGTDVSRLAWLYLHLDQADDARRCVSYGLKKEPGNRHLLGLRDRLGLDPPQG